MRLCCVTVDAANQTRAECPSLRSVLSVCRLYFGPCLVCYSALGNALIDSRYMSIVLAQEQNASIIVLLQKLDIRFCFVVVVFFKNRRWNKHYMVKHDSLSGSLSEKQACW